MMYERKMLRGLAVFVMVIILFSPIIDNSGASEVETKNQPFPPDDLKVSITNLTFSNSEPKEGENITIIVTVRNNGSSPIPNLTVRLMNLRFEENISQKQFSINGSEELTFNFNWTAEGGRQTITALLILDTPGSKETIGRIEEDIWVEPNPIGDVYSPILALALIFIVVFGSALIPSIWSSFTNRSSTGKKK